MKVRIVETKDKTVEMTIEELAKQEFVGLDVCGDKYFMTLPQKNMMSFVRPMGRWDNPIEKVRCITNAANSGGELHVFDTARKLYLWMAE